LWDKPEERVQKFMVDQLWSTWNELPKLWQNEMKAQLGADFQTLFLSSDTRSTESIPVERMATWLKLMGGNPPGTLQASTNALGRLTTASPDIAYRTQVFYDMRTQRFPNYYEIQNGYYDLPAGQRRAYLAKNPSLKQYWDWKSDFLYRNVDVAPYLSDTPPQPGQYYPARDNPQFSWQEWQTIISPSVQGLILDSYQTGEPVPDVVIQQLDLLAAQYNVQGGGEGLLQLIGQSIR
jgi:hypothetical protein